MNERTIELDGFRLLINDHYVIFENEHGAYQVTKTYIENLLKTDCKYHNKKVISTLRELASEKPLEAMNGASFEMSRQHSKELVGEPDPSIGKE